VLIELLNDKILFLVTDKILFYVFIYCSFPVILYRLIVWDQYNFLKEKKKHIQQGHIKLIKIKFK